MEIIMKGEQAKMRILDAAETLFGNQGFHATSLRDITSEAGVNLAAIAYYFGSKEALLEAVLKRRLGPVNRERVQMLGMARRQAGGSTLDLDSVLRAYLAPPFRKLNLLGDQGAKFMQLMGRMHSETHSPLRQLFLRQLEPVLNEFTQAFNQALPDLSIAEVHRRMHFVIGAMAHTLVWSEWMRREDSSAEDVLEELIVFCETGMKATLEDKSLMRVGA
jgi:AcrR family transcriptional regulator